MPDLKFGRKPFDPSRPRLAVSTLFQALPPPPDSVDYISGVELWPMGGNDKYGDCVPCGQYHARQAELKYGQGSDLNYSDQDVINLYTLETGFNPNDPNTDQGTVIADALSYWRKTGISGDKIVAYASVNVDNATEVKNAMNYFGHILIGFNVYQSAMDQFDAGQSWDATSKPGSLLGGHCVSVGAYDTDSKKAVTWGSTVGITDAFWNWKVQNQAVVEEAWVIVTQDWINKVSGVTPTGLDLAAFGAEYAALTGEPNPFPDAPPTPEPTPTPTPTPVPTPPGPTGPTGPPAPPPGPTPDPSVNDELAALLIRNIKHRFHITNKKDVAVYDDWLDANGY